jgi:hypothetical protein
VKRIVIATISIAVIAAMLAGASIAMAAKSQEVIAKSNGFPSGQHFNLNLHGRDCLTWTGESAPGGNSVFIPLYTDACAENATIQYLSNKRNTDNLTLYVIDPLTDPFDGDAAQVYLPYNILDESSLTVKPVGGYYVFGRILGKPKNDVSDNASHILIYPNVVIAASNATDNTTWPFPLDGEVLLDLGIITSQGNVGITDPADFYRFNPPTGDPGKGTKTGKSKGVEITQLFLWSGYVTDNVSLDLNGNGYLDEGDMALYSDPGWDPTGKTFQDWLDYLVAAGQATYVSNQWIFDIAEMMITGQRVENDGTTLFQIRLYPVATTQFESPYIGP